MLAHTDSWSKISHLELDISGEVTIIAIDPAVNDGSPVSWCNYCNYTYSGLHFLANHTNSDLHVVIKDGSKVVGYEVELDGIVEFWSRSAYELLRHGHALPDNYLHPIWDCENKKCVKYARKSIKFIGLRITGGYSSTSGALVHLQGFEDFSVTILLQDCIIDNFNSYNDGGVITVENANVQIERSEITNCTVEKDTGRGGFMLLINSYLNVVDSFLTNNQAGPTDNNGSLQLFALCFRSFQNSRRFALFG